MNKFEIELLKRAFQNYENTGNPEAIYQTRNGDDWLYNSEALRSLVDDGYVTTDGSFDPDETNLGVIMQPIHYSITQKGIDYIKEHPNL
ncbi:hypothetical protein BK140_33265 [Paenibacillus macerans]|nr:hypothetical protein BK140_33265 [Paenibacillus macerans]